MRTKEKLALALEDEGLDDMALLARAGRYDDCESESATPIADLVSALRALGKERLARSAMSGDFDCTKEEADAWAASPEGKAVFEQLGVKP